MSPRAGASGEASSSPEIATRAHRGVGARAGPRRRGRGPAIAGGGPVRAGMDVWKTRMGQFLPSDEFVPGLG